MKGTFKGYDPELGKKFMEESNGLVIGRARSSPKKSEAEVIEAEAIEVEAIEAQAIEEYSQEHGRAPDVQQLHDWINR